MKSVFKIKNYDGLIAVIVLFFLSQLSIAQSSFIKNFHTYVGGAGRENVGKIVQDPLGQYYVIGGTNSVSGISTQGSIQPNNTSALSNKGNHFIAKFSSDGKQFIWGTYTTFLKSTFPFVPRSIAFDTVTNSLYVAGEYAADSISFGTNTHKPYKQGGGMYLLRLDTAGSPIWSTYLGGLPYSGEHVGEIALDEAGNIFVVGVTSSDTAIATSGAHQTTLVRKQNQGPNDAFLMAFDSTGNKLFGTYLGGDAEDVGLRIALHDSLVLVSGRTESDTGIVTSGTFLQKKPPNSFTSQNTFIVAFNKTGQRLWGTYFSGTISSILPIDSVFYVVGNTENDTLISSGHFAGDTLKGASDGFIVSFDYSGNKLRGRFLGGSDRDAFSHISQLNDSSFALVGNTGSTDLKVIHPIDSVNNGNEDVYLCIIDQDFNLQMQSYYGGGSRDWGNFCSYDAPFLSIGGYTESSGNGTVGIHQQFNNGDYDGFIARFLHEPCSFYNPAINLNKTDPLCFNSNNGTIKVNQKASLINYNYYWNNQDTKDSIFGLAAGKYAVTLTDSLGCVYADSIQLSQPLPISLSVQEVDSVMCYGDSTATLVSTYSGGTAPYTLQWNTNANSDSIKMLASGNYSVTITDKHNCIKSLNYIVGQPDSLSIHLSLTNESRQGAKDGKASSTVSGGISPYSYNWTSGGLSDNTTNLAAGSYGFTVTDHNGCVKSTEFVIADLHLGVPFLLKSTQIKLYPNPAHDFITLHFGNEALSGTIKITDVLGQVVHTQFIESENSVVVSTSILPSGNYYLQISNGEMRAYYKFVVKH
ncbi:MAG: T9SS type A sorting domain-containing protein [Flavobacteriales bacterium]|nr:T9SS type A sorting domain-containing protein [Flavobacteriales bacterium]